MHTHMLTLVTRQLVSDGSELGIKTATFCHIHIYTYLQSVFAWSRSAIYVHVAVVGLGRERGGVGGGGAQFTKLESSWTRCLHIHVCSMNTRRGLTR